MTFEAFEEGPEGYPIELYEFTRGLTKYYLTSSDESVVYQANTYLPIQIERQGIEVNEEMERQPLKIRIQRDADLLDNFVQYPPTQILTLTIYRYHENDTPTPEVVVIWRGRVIAADWQGSQANLECEPVYTSLKRPGLRRRYTAQCPHVLYGLECGLDRNAFDVAGVVSVIDTANVQITAPQWVGLGSGYLRGGYVVFDNAEFRTITGYSSGAGRLTLRANIADLEIGNTVVAFPGCRHNISDCASKFNNLDNYGGFPFVPGKNPFGGTILF